jgi:hypothetical protein
VVSIGAAVVAVIVGIGVSGSLADGGLVRGALVSLLLGADESCRIDGCSVALAVGTLVASRRVGSSVAGNDVGMSVVNTVGSPAVTVVEGASVANLAVGTFVASGPAVGTAIGDNVSDTLSVGSGDMSD